MQKSNTFLIDKRHPLRVQVVASPKEIPQPPLRYKLIYFQDPDHYLTPQPHVSELSDFQAKAGVAGT